MSTGCLGNHFDIHGGGLDLKFPHHENEIAQSEAATGEKFVNLWMHNGFVEINEEKMSKSLGNFFTVREVLKQYKAEEIRYFILASHYRSPLNYSDSNLDQARNALNRLYTSLRGYSLKSELMPAGEPFQQRFQEVMDDDFNTPGALAVLFDLSHNLNRARDEDTGLASELASSLRYLAGILGLLQRDTDDYLKETASSGGLDTDRIEWLIQQRNAARAARDWAEADRIRDELKANGIVLEDAAGETSWRRE